MPSLARSVLRPDLARKFGVYESFATTTNIAADKLVISTELTSLGYDQASLLLKGWVFIKGTANVNVSRMIGAYAATGQITVRGTNLAAESAAKNCEILPFSATRLHDALNQARFDAFPYICLPRRLILPTLRGNRRTFKLPSGLFRQGPDEIRIVSLGPANSISRNLLKSDDADFADVANAWVIANMTTGKTMTPVDAGDQLVPLVTGSTVGFFLTNGLSTAATVLNTLGTAFQIRGLELSFEVWVYCETASRIKARIAEDATTSDSAFHTGTGWEILKVRRSITTEPTALKVGVVDTTNTAALRFYTARAFASQGPAELAEESSYETLTEWDPIPPYGTDTTFSIRFTGVLPGDKAIEIRGRDYLTALAAETDTFEIDEQQESLLLAYATRRIAEEELGTLEPGSQSYGRMEAIRAREQNNIDLWTQRNEERGLWAQPVYIGLGRQF